VPPCLAIFILPLSSFQLSSVKTYLLRVIESGFIPASAIQWPGPGLSALLYFMVFCLFLFLPCFTCPSLDTCWEFMPFENDQARGVALQYEGNPDFKL
jgi:hypothetical protein